MQKYCFDVKRGNAMIFSCEFRNLTNFKCYCTYYSSKLRKDQNEIYHYIGDEFEEYHYNHTNPAIYVSSGEINETFSFFNFFDHCRSQEEDLILRCYTPQQYKYSRAICACNDNDYSKSLQNLHFMATDVWTNRNLFLSDGNRYKPPPPPPTNYSKTPQN